jgi:hypothetical protein
VSGVKRIGGGPAVHHVSYIEHPQFGRMRIVTCRRRFIKKSTTDEASVSCFSCLQAMGKLDAKPKKKAIAKERICTLCKRLGRSGFVCRKCGVTCCEHLCGNKEHSTARPIPATCTSCLISRRA